MLRAAAAFAPVCADGFELGYVDGARVRHRTGLANAANVAFEDVLPVRSYPSFRRQRNSPGLWWSATSGRHVAYESWLERDEAVLLDFDPSVVGFAAQPFWLFWRDHDRLRAHAPDWFVRLDTDLQPVALASRIHHLAVASAQETKRLATDPCARLRGRPRRSAFPQDSRPDKAKPTLKISTYG